MGVSRGNQWRRQLTVFVGQFGAFGAGPLKRALKLAFNAHG